MSVNNPSKPENPLQPGSNLPTPSQADGFPLVPKANGTLEPARRFSQSMPALIATPDAVALLKALRYRWLLAATLGLIVGAPAAFATWYFLPQAKPVYLAYAMVEFGSPTLVFPLGDIDYNAYRQTQADLLRTRMVLRAALDRPDAAQLPAVKADRDGVVKWLERDLKIENIGLLMKISLTGSDPTELEVLVNEVKDAYLDKIIEAEHAAKKKQYDTLEKVYQECQQRLIDAKKPGPQPEDLTLEEQQRKLEEFEALQRELTRLELDAMRVGIRRDLAKRGAVKLEPSQVKEWIAQDQEMQRYKKRIARIEALIAEYIKLVPSTSAGPGKEAIENLELERKDLIAKMKQREQELIPFAEKELRDRLLRSISERTAQLVEEENYVGEQKKTIEEMVASRFKTIKLLNQGMLDQELRRFEIERLKTITKYVGDQQQAVRVELSAPRHAASRQDAVVPDPKAGRNDANAVVAVGLCSFVFVVLCVAWWEYRSRRIHTADEVVQTLGINLLGAMPALPKRVLRRPAGLENSRYIYWQNLLIQAIDGIRTLLLHEAGLESARVIMVTSAVGREGKTTFASHLAASLARGGKKTVLVDSDLLRPSVQQIFEQPLEPGLCEVLRGKAELPDVIRPTEIQGLWTVSAGKVDRPVILSLAKENLAPIFEKLKLEFDVVIVDSSPVLPVAQTLLVGKQVDAVILAIMHDVSRVPPVYAAYNRLTNLGIRVLGAIFSKASDDVYGYGYYGSYGYHYKLPLAQPPAPQEQPQK